MNTSSDIKPAPQSGSSGPDESVAAAAPKMDAEVKAMWVAALRSGKYLQGREFLRTIDDRYCCIGVLTDLLFPNDWTMPTDVHAGYSYAGRSCWPTYFENTTLDYEDIRTLVTLNDRDQKSFSEIADWIEANPNL